MRWGHLVGLWCVLFAALHVYWALGGSLGLASSAGADLAARRPAEFVLFGLWGVAVALCVGAAFGVALAGWRPGDVLRRGMLVLGWLTGVVLLLRGLVLELVLLTGFGDVARSVGELQTRVSLVLWNPWFVLGGVLVVLATWQFQRLSRAAG